MSELLPLLKIIGVFAVVVGLMRWKLNIGGALIVGSLFIGLLTSMTLDEIRDTLVLGITSPKTIVLVLMIALISIFNSSLQKNDRLGNLVTSFSNIIPSKRFGLMFFPGIIALLPMPGGAFFSAPMVKQTAAGTDLSPSRQAAINYWFRHVWEFSWPFYPTMLWICQTYNYSLSYFLLRVSPFTLLAILSGILVMMRGLPHRGFRRISMKELSVLVHSISPLAMLLVLVVVFELLIGLSSELISFELPNNSGFVFALLVSILVLWIRDAFSGRQIRTLIFAKSTGNLILIILGVMLFQTFLNESFLAVDLGTFFAALGIPVLLLAIIFPMLIGAMMGYTLSALSATLPVVVAAAGLSLGDPHILGLIVLSFVSSFFGVMLAPVHSCFVLTRDYFKAKWREMYKLVFISYLPLMAAAVILFFIF